MSSLLEDDRALRYRLCGIFLWSRDLFGFTRRNGEEGHHADAMGNVDNSINSINGSNSGSMRTSQLVAQSPPCVEALCITHLTCIACCWEPLGGRSAILTIYMRQNDMLYGECWIIISEIQ
eukprot:scaffold63115_cov44-Attheya_sp.AAC.2